MEFDVLKKIKLGKEFINLKELLPTKKKALIGESHESEPKSVTIETFLDLVRKLIVLYSKHHAQHTEDMWEHYRFLELIVRKNSLSSVMKWDKAVRGRSGLGRWHQGNLPFVLATAILEPTVTASQHSSQTGQNAGRQPREPNGTRGNGQKRQKSKRVCFNWADGRDCSYKDDCRFLHQCPVCPGNKDHKQANCPDGSNEKWGKRKTNNK